MHNFSFLANVFAAKQKRGLYIIQLVRQRLDQQEETKKGCSAGSDIKSVVHKLCEVKNCGTFYSENTMELSVLV